MNAKTRSRKRGSLAALAVLLTLSRPLVPLQAQESVGLGGDERSSLAQVDAPGRSWFSVYGHLSNELSSVIPVDTGGVQTPRWGNRTGLRLKADWQPEDRVSVHAEMSYDWVVGEANSITLMRDLGMPSPMGPLVTWEEYQAANAQDDFVSGLTLDHAWALVNLGRFDLQVGKFPIAWGTGYAFNPTDTVNQPSPFADVESETPGTLAVMASVQILDWLGATGYLAFQAKGADRYVLGGDRFAENYPFGVKILAVVGPRDLSVSFSKEVTYDLTTATHRHTYRSGFDVFAAFGGLGLYGEGTLAFPQEGNRIGFGGELDFADALRVVVGGEYKFTDGPAIRIEYFHNGAGSGNRDTYDFYDLIAGERLGREYALLHFDHAFGDFVRVSAAGLANLTDGSIVLVPQISYSALGNLDVELGAQLFFGGRGTEFNGAFDPVTGLGTLEGPADLTEHRVFVRAKVSF